VKANPADRRSRLLTLTARGRSLLARAVPVWKRTNAQVEELIPDGDPGSLRNNLRALSSSLRRSPIIPPH
jgi:DNA-binding MarR family transcriptional regulator